MERLRALKSEKPLPHEPTKPTKPGFDGFEGVPGRRFSENEPVLPADILAGLGRLKAEPGPRIANPAVWPEVVADACRLADEGWAAKALALGWEALELFGASPAVGGDDRLDSLAVWLGGRQLVLIGEHSAVVAEGRARSIFPRFDPAGAVMLWELRDVQRGRMRAGR